MPPMHPTASRMPFGLERFVPDVTPFLPAYRRSLPDASPSRTYRLADGDTLTLTASMVGRRLRGHTLTMYAYDGQIPGPRLEIPQGVTVTVRYRNLTDLPGSIHWHGLRLTNADDGVPGLTQPPVPPGGEFVYRVHAPDAGDLPIENASLRWRSARDGLWQHRYCCHDLAVFHGDDRRSLSFD